MKFKTMKFIALVFIGLLTIIGSAQLTLAIPSGNFPEPTRACIPDTVWRYTIGEVRFLAQTRYQSVNYYLFHLVPSNSRPFRADKLLNI